MIKLPRKNILAIVEGDQVKLNKLIDDSRNDIKKKLKELLELSPNVSEMDPYVVKLLLKENHRETRLKSGIIDEEDEEELSDNDI